MAPNDTAHGQHYPVQDRSRDTAERILAAAGDLLVDRTLDDLSVADIARRAKVSVGGFYARFANKEALLHAFDARILEQATVSVERALDETRTAGWTLSQVAEAFVSVAFRFFSKNRNILRQVALRSRAGTDPAFAERVGEFNDHVHGLVRARLLARRDEIHHPDPDTALELGVIFVSAALREEVLFGERRPTPSSARGKRLVRELTRALCAYLGAKA